MIIEAISPTSPVPFTLRNVSWELYELLLRDVEGQNVRVTYDNGSLVVMSPLPIHEKLRRITGMLVEMATFTLKVPMATLGSTTWKRQDIAKGLEADECYYIQNERRVRELTEFDLTRDPPPDLAIEVDVTHNPLHRPSIYAALRVNEVWRHDGKRIEFLKLGSAEAYEPLTRSEAFPLLTPDVINRHLQLIGTMADTEIAATFHEWLLGVAKG